MLIARPGRHQTGPTLDGERAVPHRPYQGTTGVELAHPSRRHARHPGRVRARAHRRTCQRWHRRSTRIGHPLRAPAGEPRDHRGEARHRHRRPRPRPHGAGAARRSNDTRPAPRAEPLPSEVSSSSVSATSSEHSTPAEPEQLVLSVRVLDESTLAVTDSARSPPSLLLGPCRMTSMPFRCGSNVSTCVRTVVTRAAPSSASIGARPGPGSLTTPTTPWPAGWEIIPQLGRCIGTCCTAPEPRRLVLGVGVGDFVCRGSAVGVDGDRFAVVDDSAGSSRPPGREPPIPD